MGSNVSGHKTFLLLQQQIVYFYPTQHCISSSVECWNGDDDNTSTVQQPIPSQLYHKHQQTIDETAVVNRTILLLTHDILPRTKDFTLGEPRVFFQQKKEISIIHGKTPLFNRDLAPYFWVWKTIRVPQRNRRVHLLGGKLSGRAKENGVCLNPFLHSAHILGTFWVIVSLKWGSRATEIEKLHLFRFDERSFLQLRKSLRKR